MALEFQTERCHGKLYKSDYRDSRTAASGNRHKACDPFAEDGANWIRDDDIKDTEAAHELA